MSPDRTRASLELLLNISRELAASLDLNTVLNRVLLLSARNVGAERGSLVALDEYLRPVEAAIIVEERFVPHTLQQLQGIVSHGLAGWVLRNQKAALVLNSREDDRWLRRPDDEAEGSGPKAAICVPLLAQDEIVGVMTMVHPEPGTFNEDHLALLQAIGDLAGIAIRNAQLYHSLQTVNQLYRELFEDSIDPLIITDWNGRILQANRRAAEDMGTPAHELVGANISTLHTVAWDVVGPQYGALRGGVMVSYESILHRVRRRDCPVQVHVRAINYSGEDSLQWIIRDITERKQLDSLREDLAAMIYHDLRSPLSNIVSSLDILTSLTPVQGDASAAAVMQIAVRSTERMQRLINSLLDINKLESGQPIASRQAVDSKELVHAAVEAVLPFVDGKQIKLKVSLPAELPAIHADEDMVRRVLINLMENAIKFTPQEGGLQVGAAAEPDKVRFWVQDTGPGIPPEARQLIFEKFTRLQVERSPKGLGLGLAFCRLAVQAHGGRIWVEGEPEQGSCFNFTIPIAPPQP
ncbi:MAG TPA: ATP-binding protein [Anaerolineaceae bacterium]|nr:ATP-binding protein [Anaerolineaceae bacterium]HOG79772.1 ATP-binding protein [Anaerolineaceae bacterium]